MRVVNLLIVIFAATSLLLVPAVVALGQQYPVTEGTFSTLGDVSDRTYLPGDEVVLGGGGFEPGAAVVITMNASPTPLLTTSADAKGRISARVRIPDAAEVGEHTLKATGPAPGGGTTILSATVRVVAPGTDTELADTGRDLLLPIAAPVLLFLAGGILVVRARRN